MVALNLQQGLIDLVIVSLIAALTPLAAALLSRLRVPQVVILIVGGIVVGPQVLGWAEPDTIELISNLGLGFLFLLAGYELDLSLFRERAGRLAITSWLVTAAVAVGGDRGPGGSRARQRLRADRARIDHDSARHAVAHPAGQPPAGGPVRGASSWRPEP